MNDWFNLKQFRLEGELAGKQPGHFREVGKLFIKAVRTADDILGKSQWHTFLSCLKLFDQKFCGNNNGGKQRFQLVDGGIAEADFFTYLTVYLFAVFHSYRRR